MRSYKEIKSQAKIGKQKLTNKPITKQEKREERDFYFN